MRPIAVNDTGEVNSPSRSTTSVRPRSGAANRSTASFTQASMRPTLRGVRAAETSRRPEAGSSELVERKGISASQRAAPGLLGAR